MKQQILYKFVLALLVFPMYLAAQPVSADSLIKKVKTAKTEPDRSKAYLQLAIFYWNRARNRDGDSSLLNAQNALEIANSARLDSLKAACDKVLGVIYEKNGQYTTALRFDLEALSICEQLKLEMLERRTLNNIGLVYLDIGDYPRAINYYSRALNAARMQPVQANIRLGTYFDNLAEAYAENKQFDSAIVYSKLAIESAEKIKDTTELSFGLLNVGLNLMQEGQYKEALPFIKEALQIATKKGDEERVVLSNLRMAKALEFLKQNNQSIAFAKTALVKAQKLHLLQAERDINNTLYLNYKDKGDVGTALLFRNTEITIGDSLFNLQKSKELQSLQSDYELEKKQHQIDILNKDKIIREGIISSEMARRYVFITAVVFLTLACIILFRSNSLVRRLNKLLNERSAEILEQNKKLESLNMIKNKILSIIGHDLRSPFSTLKSFVYLIQKSSNGQLQIQYFVEKMNETLVGTSHLLENLLFWAKSQMEGMTTNPAQFDLQEVIKQNVKLMQSRADQKKVSLMSGDVLSPPIAFADETMIDIVVRNLLENAIKYSIEGDSVELSVTHIENYVQVAIKDSGKGIAEKDQAKLMTGAVSTFSTIGTLQEKGSGLGLSLCKDLVENNGGRIWFESTPGKGTTFFFTVPSAERFLV